MSKLFFSDVFNRSFKAARKGRRTMKKSARQSVFDKQFRAACKYTPESITHALKRDENGVIYADRSMLVHNDDEEYEFRMALDFLYRWGFRNAKNSTIYLEIDGDTIRGGIYYLDSKTCERSYVVGVRYKSPSDSGKHWFPSLYFDKEYYDLCDKISKI